MKRPSVYPHEVLAVRDKFKRWLCDRGAEVLEPLVDHELLRFKTGKGLSIIYGRRGNPELIPCSFYGEAATAWREFQNPDTTWRAIPATKRPPYGVDRAEFLTIRKRDGHNCFYCCEFLKEDDATIEHLVSLTHGGPQHISNKFLAHRDCNNKAGNLSAVEKIEIRVQSKLRQLMRFKNGK